MAEFDWGGCLLTDRGSVDEIQALAEREMHVYGQPGTLEAIWLVKGTVPWPGSPWPRPVYRVRWTPQPEGGSSDDGEARERIRRAYGENVQPLRDSSGGRRAASEGGAA